MKHEKISRKFFVSQKSQSDFSGCQKLKNLKTCNCTYPGCPRKGLCCQCLKHHLQNQELPACCFPPDIEKTYDRSFAKFIKCVKAQEF